MTDPIITCPGCQQPLQVPLDAVGKPAHCPHCRTNFFLPANPDGSPGIPQRIRPKVSIPRLLAAPGLALLIVGLIGTLVNGSLALMFTLNPDSAMNYARGQVQEFHNLDAMLALKESRGKAAKAEGAVPEPNPEADEELAASWAPAMRPLHTTFLIISLVTVAGASAMLKRRWYPLAILGCVAGIVNINNFCCVPGGIAGLWGILVLVRDDARVLFRQSGSDPQIPAS